MEGSAIASMPQTRVRKGVRYDGRTQHVSLLLTKVQLQLLYTPNYICKCQLPCLMMRCDFNFPRYHIQESMFSIHGAVLFEILQGFPCFIRPFFPPHHRALASNWPSSPETKMVIPCRITRDFHCEKSLFFADQ